MEAIDLVSRLLEYTPSARISPLEACAHTFFEELRDPHTRLPNGRELPVLFNFTEHGNNSFFPTILSFFCPLLSLLAFGVPELKIQPALNAVLIPPHMRGASGLMGVMNATSPSQDSSATGSPNSAGGAEGSSAAGASAAAVGHIHSPPDVCSTAGENLGAVGTA